MSSNRAIVFSGVLIAGAALAAYHSTFGVPFLADDIPAIIENPAIRQLWPLSVPLHPPQATGLGGRPVLNLSLAMNHAIGGTSPWSYHVVNLLIHIASGLLLFGLVRRVLPRVAGGRGFATPPVVGKGPDRVVPPYHLKVFATPAACAVALLWTLHPLQTQAVTHVAGRAESLPGLFYLLALYAFVRMAGAGGGWRWGTVSALACLLGSGMNGAAMTAPVFVLMADRVFYCDSVVAALRKRPLYYLALAGSWVLLAGLVSGADSGRGAAFQADGGAFLKYWLTQPEALTRYLGLALWPHPLVFDYGPEVHPSRVVMLGCAVMLALLLVLTAWLWWRRRPEALGLGAFFLLLAPTSLVPGEQLILESRMYLPLAALMGVLVAATAARNADYQDAVRLWSDTVQKRPANARAHQHLGDAQLNRGDAAAAVRHYEQALRLDPALAAVRERLAHLRATSRPD
jgi:protein O-mannosyl-transferase